MARQTELLGYSDDDLRKMGAQEVKRLLKKSIRYVYTKHRELEKEIGTVKYNEEFRRMMNARTEYSALKNMENLDLNSMKKQLSLIKRNLKSDKSTKEGILRRDKKSIETINRLLSESNTGSDKEPEEFVYSRKTDTFVYKDKIITRKELSNFWENVRKIQEDDSSLMRRVKGGSDSAVSMLAEKFFSLKNGLSFNKMRSILMERAEEDSAADEAIYADIESRLKEAKKRRD